MDLVRARRWLLVWGLLVVAANLRAALTAVGPVLDQVQADLGLPTAAMGLLTTVPLLMFGVVSPFVPRLAARWGAERLLGGALLVLALGIATRSVPTWPGVFGGTALIGIGIAVGNVLLPSLIKRHFPDRVGLLTAAYATVMGGVAAVAAGLAVPISGPAGDGWRTALGWWLLPALAAVALWAPQTRVGAAAGVAREGHRLPWRSPLAWAVTVFFGLQSLGFYVLINWLPRVVRDQGVDAAGSGWLMSVFQVVALISSLLMPVALRYVRDQRLLGLAGSGVLLIGYLGLLAVPGLPLLWSIVLGLGGGACLVLALALLSLRAGDPTAAGSLAAMAQSVGYLVAAAGPMLFGWLHTLSSEWRIPILLLCAGATAQVIAGVLAGRGTVGPSSSAVAGSTDEPSTDQRRPGRQSARDHTAHSANAQPAERQPVGHQRHPAAIEPDQAALAHQRLAGGDLPGGPEGHAGDRAEPEEQPGEGDAERPQPDRLDVLGRPPEHASVHPGAAEQDRLPDERQEVDLGADHGPDPDRHDDHGQSSPMPRRQVC